MGVYDTIRFRCLACGKDLFAQSKSGDCVLADYDAWDVPMSVAFDANRHAPFECECGRIWKFGGDIPGVEDPRVSLNIVDAGLKGSFNDPS